MNACETCLLARNWLAANADDRWRNFMNRVLYHLDIYLNLKILTFEVTNGYTFMIYVALIILYLTFERL